MQRFMSNPPTESNFPMLPVKTKQRITSRRLLNIFITRQNIRKSVRQCRKAFSLSVPRERVKRCLQRRLPVKRMFRFSQCRVRNLLKCLSEWALQRCAIFSSRRKKKRRALFLSMRLTQSEKSERETSAAMMSASRP